MLGTASDQAVPYWAKLGEEKISFNFAKWSKLHSVEILACSTHAVYQLVVIHFLPHLLMHSINYLLLTPERLLCTFLQPATPNFASLTNVEVGDIPPPGIIRNCLTLKNKLIQLKNNYVTCKFSCAMLFPSYIFSHSWITLYEG